MPGIEKLFGLLLLLKEMDFVSLLNQCQGNQLSIDQLLIDLDPLVKAGLGGVLLFGLAESSKDSTGTEAFRKTALCREP